MRSVISAFALLLGTCVMGEPSEDPEIRADYFVSVDGNDSWSGKFSLPNREGTDGPLASLAAARDTVRRNGDRSADQDVTVLIRGGVFRIDRTVVFGLEDSAAPGHSIVYTAYPGEKPVFSSGVEIGPWVKAHIPPDRLPEQAVGKVWIADIPKELNSFHTLYDRRTRLPRARSAGSTPRGEPNTPGSSRTRLLFPRGMLKEWPNLNDVEIVIRPQVQFTMNILTLESVDESECVAETSIPASYPLTNPGRKGWTLYPKMPNTLWVENVLEVLDKPGEWVVDTNAGKIFLWPGIEKPGRNIVAPRLREFVRVEGDIDFEGERDEPVRGLIFRGLTFTHGDRDVWTGEDAGLQHDWALYDKGDALIRFRGAENCAVQECRFVNSGGGAVRLDLHCRNNRIAGNDIEHIGGCGILVAGYGPGTKDVSTSNEITDNYIHHGAEIFWHSPGIMIWQSGANRIANNLIHDLPGMGIVISGVRPQFFSRSLRECSRTIRQHEAGEVRTMEEALPFLHARDNTIENNEIHHVVTMMGDSNAIYISGAGKGNTIRRNYVHDIVGGGTHSAIRTDGWQSGTLITENVIRRCLRAGITRKYDNDVVNNIIIDVIEDSDNPIVKSAFWGYIEFRSFPGETRVKGAKVRRNICFHSGQRANFYHVVNARTRPVDCDTDYNLFFLAADPAAGREFLNEQQSKGIDAHSICADPLFVDLEGGDLRLKQDSPAFSLGIKTVDLAHIGLGREASGR